MINSDNGTEIVYRIPYSSDIIIVKIAARNKAARKRGKFPQLICIFLNLTMLLLLLDFTFCLLPGDRYNIQQRPCITDKILYQVGKETLARIEYAHSKKKKI